MMQFDRTDTVLPEVWASHARLRPQKPALVCEGETLSWDGFNRAMNRLANALLRHRVRKGEAVAVLVSSSIAACVAMFGTVKSGAIMVPVSTMLTEEQVATILRDCRATHLICSADLRHLVDPVRAGLEDLRDDGLIGVDFDDEAWQSLESFTSGSSEADPPVTHAGHDVFSIMYSSGTTGAPKGVTHSHSARTYFAVSNALEMGFGLHSRGLVTTALFTAGTWLIVQPTLFVGGTLHIHPKYDPERLMRELEESRISHCFAVPSQLRPLLAENRFDDCDLSSLQVLLSAGSPLHPEEKTRLIEKIGEVFFELYGFTEGCSTLLRPEDQASKPLTVGKTLMGQELRIIGDDGEVLPPGEAGEIAGRGPGLLTEYHGRPEATEAALWRDEAGRSYIRSGDIGRMDEEGFLTIVDRKKDMIISGGMNVYPADIEAILSAHPDVADCCVFGINHAKWGEAPMAAVVAADGASAAGDEVLAWTNARLAKHQRLDRIALRDSLPRNALGKVLKQDLRKEYDPAANA